MKRRKKVQRERDEGTGSSKLKIDSFILEDQVNFVLVFCVANACAEPTLKSCLLFTVFPSFLPVTHAVYT